MIFPLACILSLFVLHLLATLYTRLDNAIAIYRIGRALIAASGSKREARLAIENAYLARDLLAAAGSALEARLAIEEVRLNAALCRKFGAEFLRTTHSNVVKFVPRIVSGGREVSFPPDGSAA